MRVLLVCVILSLSLLSDEIQRIESIVKDITSLRAEYEECKSSLEKKNSNIQTSNNAELESKIKELEALVEYEKEKNKSIKKELLLDFSKKQLSFEKQLKNLKELLKNKENKLSRLEKKYNKLSTNRVLKKKNLNNLVFDVEQKCIDDNEFPALVMKEKIRAQKIIAKTVVVEPQAFRLRETTFIYDKPSGSVVEKWEENRSFTSNQKSNNWIKITGFFVDKLWRKSQKSLWIEEKFVIKK